MGNEFSEDTRDIHDIVRQKQNYKQSQEKMTVWDKDKGLIKEDTHNGLSSKVQQKG